MSDIQTAAGRYEELEAIRRPFLERARLASKYTIPALLPPEGHSGASSLYTPFQSTGADGVNNLAAKLLMAMFPPGVQFFRLTMDDYVVQDLASNTGSEDARGTFEAALGRVERAVVNEMESEGARKSLFEGILHEIVTGNGLLYVDRDASLRFYALDRYVVSRDSTGKVLEIIVRESMDRRTAPEKVRAIVENHSGEQEPGESDQEVVVYTWVQRQPRGNWKVHQEVCDETVPGSEGTYPKGKSAWIPLRWVAVSGEDYGRGRCEEYIGDILSLEKLDESLLRFAGAAGRILTFVNESGLTDIEDVAGAENGDVIPGRKEDVGFLTLDKGIDYQILSSKAEETRKRLERAFLMSSSWQRNAERVTAEEVRIVAGELEQGLGGVYSVQSEEFQRPLVTRLMHQLSQGRNPKIPKLPEGAVAPQIVTGLDGLGRNVDLHRLDSFIQGTAAQIGQEAIARHINVSAYMERRAAALGIDVNGLIRSPEEIQQQDQQAQAAEMAGKLGGPTINAMSQQALAQQKNPEGES